MNTIDDDLARLGASLRRRAERDDRARTRRHRVVAAAVAVAVALGTTGGAWAIARAPQKQLNYSAECYGAADLSSRHGTTDFGAGERADPLPLDERIELATDQCAASWRVGTFERDHATTTREDYPVPRLVACELTDGRLGVFPSTRSAAALCADLGLAAPTR